MDVNSDAGVAGQVLLGQQQAGASVRPAPAGERALGTGSLGTFLRPQRRDHGPSGG